MLRLIKTTRVHKYDSSITKLCLVWPDQSLNLGTVRNSVTFEWQGVTSGRLAGYDHHAYQIEPSFYSG